MKAAAPKTYISRRMLDRYSEQRQIQQQQQQESNSSGGNPAPVLPPKQFAEDKQEAAIGNASDVDASKNLKSSADPATSTVLAPIEEEKKEMEETKQNIKQTEPKPAAKNAMKKAAPPTPTEEKVK